MPITQDFNPASVRLSDITYIYTREGWLYLCVVMDLFNREIIGWAMGRRLKRQLVIDACERAILKRRPDEGLIFHSDRGSQYASGEFRKLLKDQRITQSMSGKGNCYDNAVMESFFGTSHFDTRGEAKQMIFEYIEIFYNRRRLHSSLGYKTPLEFGNEKKVA
ncbi:IS3 family transposase [Candidatus Marinimicrobia bacterium MT.SAG.4]|nr:IS3 family transposase [Candidatus Marinimicrobia bacterium MT.SAG.4]